jgi:membrane protease YdiL (CAAX protease family)
VTGSLSVATVCLPAIVVIIPLVAAAWLPADFPYGVRQLLLCVWGVGAIVVAERWLFEGALAGALRAVGFRRVRVSAMVVAALIALPMWGFVPLFAWSRGLLVQLQPDWLERLIGVALVNGIAEEVIHRGFVFGHLRRGRTFAVAATISAALFALQHAYLIVTTGWLTGFAAVMLGALLAYPFARIFERGGRSLAPPALLHTSSNAPMSLFALPTDFITAAVLPHMGVVLFSLYLVFAMRSPEELEAEIQTT